MEHTSDLVYEGKLIHEESYPQRSVRYEELAIDGIKIDFYDARNKIVHEVKKSNKIAPAHRLQLLYYLYVLEQNGILGATGILEYPKLRKTEEILLTDIDRENIKKIMVSSLYRITDLQALQLLRLLLLGRGVVEEGNFTTK